MSLELPLAQWKTALTGLGKVVNKRASLPVLSAIRADREAGGLALTATDLDRTLTHFPDASGPERSFLIPFEPNQTDGTTLAGAHEKRIRFSFFPPAPSPPPPGQQMH